ncbi:hypothetical protein [Streptomyces noursei]|uniref:hypothetical protein n=1 Tax=Streptomyces noursei TaxID=1971 RepID=UPI001672B7EB|nr:hypothetical protein [Streptomyces noursei]MCZ1017029.1 hypothetical protein [Streptomyces noursei]GGX05138.1 hypothetical protein GCM10010341_28300 [Streptomyces noursei]
MVSLPVVKRVGASAFFLVGLLARVRAKIRPLMRGCGGPRLPGEPQGRESGEAPVGAKAGATACEGILIQRTEVEKEVFKWLKREAAAGIDSAPPTEPAPERSLADERAANVAARARAQAEVDRQRQALARLRAEHAANPDDYGPGEYEEAADVIRKKRAEAQALLDSIPAEVEPLPERNEFVPLIVGTAEEWHTFDTRGRNNILRKLIRRVAITRHGAGVENHEIQIHPMWEPDPWADPKKAAATAGNPPVRDSGGAGSRPIPA